MAASGSAVLTNVIINLVVALIGVLLGSIWVIWGKTYKLMDPKRDNPAVKVKPAPLPQTFLAWVKPIFSYAEPDIIKQCGLDTAIYLRLLRFGYLLFSFLTFWTLAVVLPVNKTDDFVSEAMSTPDSGFDFTTFDELSLANIQPGSQRMWVHLVSVYVISGVTLWLLWRYSKESVVLRIQFVGNSKGGKTAMSVLVTDVPGIADATHKAAKEAKAASMSSNRSAKLSDSGTLTEKLAPAGDVEEGADRATSVAKILVQDVPSDSPAPAAAKSPSASGGAVPSGPSGNDFLAGPSASAIRAGALRQRKVFEYDLASTSLDPRIIAAKALDAGTSPEGLVTDEFRLVYGSAVDEVNIVKDQAALEKLVAEYSKRVQEVEDFLSGVEYKTATNQPLARPTVLLIAPDAWCKEKYGGGLIKKVDGLSFWPERIAWLEAQIKEQQDIADTKLWPAAFVTFKSRVAQSVSATGLHTHNEMTWKVQGAPEPRELLWFNLGMDSAVRTFSTILLWILFWLMCCFYMIPIAAIQGLIDVPVLAENVPGLGDFLNIPVIKMLVEAVLPGLVLKIFLAILPWILSVMVTRSGAVCISEVDRGVVSRFFLFQLVVVFFGSALAGSFFSQATALLDNPTSIVNTLGTALPQSATFFITYVWINFGGVGLGFARIVGVILFWLFSYLAGSPKAAKRVYQEQYTTYGTAVSGHMLVLLVGVVYSVINPIITPSALAYFGLAMVVEKYNNIYVTRRQYESGGQLWATLVTQVMIVLYVFELTMIGLLAVKKFPYAVLIIPVLLPTVAVHTVITRLFRRPWALTSLHDAAQLDINDKLDVGREAEEGLLEEEQDYLSPVFKVKEGDAAGLLADIKNVIPKVEEAVARQEAEAAAAKAAKKK